LAWIINSFIKLKDQEIIGRCSQLENTIHAY
jgi:hypothetical protein